MSKGITVEVQISSDEEDSEEKKKNKIIVNNKCLYWKSNFKNVAFEGTIFKNVFFEEATLEMSFLRGQFWKCLSWGSNFENLFFWGSNLF